MIEKRIKYLRLKTIVSREPVPLQIWGCYFYTLYLKRKRGEGSGKFLLRACNSVPYLNICIVTGILCNFFKIICWWPAWFWVTEYLGISKKWRRGGIQKKVGVKSAPPHFCFGAPRVLILCSKWWFYVGIFYLCRFYARMRRCCGVFR